jgi:hypothetical protein
MTMSSLPRDTRTGCPFSVARSTVSELAENRISASASRWLLNEICDSPEIERRSKSGVTVSA